MARSRSVPAAVGLATIVGLVTPLAAAAAILWTLTASPLTATTGVLTQFTLTATNEDLLFNEIGCVVVDVPSNFSVKATAVVSTNANGPWSATADGNHVTVWAGGGGARLELLEWVKFTVDALPLAAGELAWNSNAYEDQQCRGSGSLLGVPPVVLVTGPAVTPTPSPTPTPTPTPTPSPTPTPTPLLPLPTVSLTPLPTLEILPTPTPTPTPTPRLTPRPTPTGSSSAPTPSATPAPTADDGGSAASPASSPDPTLSNAAASPGPGAGSATPAGPSGRGALARVDAPEDTLELGLGAFGAVEGVEVWFVPAAVIGAPGLLVIVWVALQTIGGVVWLPAVRRMLGDEEPARGRRST